LKALLVSGGDIENIELIKKVAKDMDFIICADGGTDYCIDANLIPDIIVGDLDSISKRGIDFIEKNKISIVKFPVKKDNTDTELAIDYLIEKGFRDITILGAIGSRMDHTLGNIFLLKKLRDKKVKGKIIDHHNIIYLVDDELKIKKQRDSYVSIIPITDNGVEVSLEGFEYPLSNSKVEFGSTLGISNEIKKSYGYIKIHSGIVLVIISRD